MRWLRQPFVYTLAALVLGAVFVYASYDKILKPAEFTRIVYHYRLIGPGATVGYVPPNLLGITLPWVELVTGLCLLSGFWRREAAMVSGGMLVMFLIAVGYALALGIDIANCGCFSSSGEGRNAGLKLIVQDLVLLAMAAYVAVVRPEHRLATAPAPAAHPLTD